MTQISPGHGGARSVSAINDERRMLVGRAEWLEGRAISIAETYTNRIGESRYAMAVFLQADLRLKAAAVLRVRAAAL